MRVIDSHTEGEPTRVVISGGPDLGGGDLQRQLAVFARDFDHIRRSLILEPRGSAALVGALLCPPTHPECASGVIFFNNAGFLGMCGHGSLGVAVTLAHLGRVHAARLKLETPVGIVSLEMHGPNEVTLQNVPSLRHMADVTVSIDGYPPLRGDVGWGGNWFFLVDWPHTPIRPEFIPQLTQVCRQIRRALQERAITGANGATIDHIELFCAADDSGADSRNFVLCPGDEYDRSPCGTGTSAKLACLAAHGRLQPGEVWTQESVIGGRFQASYRRGAQAEILPSIRGRAYVCAEAVIIRQAEDPFRDGIPCP